VTAEFRFEASCGPSTTCAVLDWAASGAMACTGHADGPPLAPRPPVVARLRDVTPMYVDLEVVLSGRAALLGLERRGRQSAGGACRLLATNDGWVAVSLGRPDDVGTVPAIVEAPVDAGDAGDAWRALEEYARDNSATVVAARCQLFGVPGAVLGEAATDRVPAVSVTAPGERRHREGEAPLVVDLSSMWAGPLCTHLLGRAGMQVVKVESVQRPDGARAHPAFFAWLHAAQEPVVLDFDDARDRDELRYLLARADVVVESSRPRALRQLGIDACDVVADRPGTTWLSITGYGRDDDRAHKVAFGDDAAVAGGVVAIDPDGAPVFAGDAIADPATGLVAADAVLRSQANGGGELVAVAMAGVAAMVAAPHEETVREHVVERRGDAWVTWCGEHCAPVAVPRAPAC
jgi:crotonobetainyl-CoA:carnitine CoA-transferase CaiB-like acyl-CoA transferase